MAKVMPPKVRLAGSGAFGAETFNFYQILTVLSGLYIHAMEHEQVEGYRVNWDHCSTSILDQIGVAYEVWGVVQRQASTGIPIPEDFPLIRRTIALAKRLIVVEDNMTQWVTAVRMSRILLLVEGRLQLILEQIVQHNPGVAATLVPTVDLVIRRMGWLKDIQVASKREMDSLNANFSEPVSLI